MSKEESTGESQPTSSKYRGPRRSSPYPMERLSSRIDLVDVAAEIQKADAAIASRVGGELEVIAEQIRSLQRQAQAVLERSALDQKLHRADCRFPKKVGHIYHLYERANGTTYFSALSPREWGGNPPHAYLGSYRLEGDQSWTEADEDAPPPPSAFERAQKILNANALSAEALAAHVEDA